MKIIKVLNVFMNMILYQMSFELMQQYNAGVKEERVNKPDRLLPSGLVDKDWFKKRIMFYIPFYLVFSLFAANNLLPALTWVINIITIYCSTGGDKHYFVKNNIFIFIGIAVEMLTVFNICYTELKDIHIAYTFINSFYFSCLIHIQDFKDVDGDILDSRRTLPIEFGVKMAKAMMTIALAVASPIFYYLVYYQLENNYYRNISSVIFVVAILAIIYTLHQKTNRSQVISYDILQYFYCFNFIVIPFIPKFI